MENKPQRKPVLLIEDLETLRIITDPLRLQIIDILSAKPMTINQVANQLGLSSSRLYYHFNLLEERGLIEVVETRMVNNLMEKRYWLAAEEIEIDKVLLDFSSGKARENLVSVVTSSLEAIRSEILRSLQARSYNLEQGARTIPRDMIINSLRKRLSDETYQKFIKRLQSLIKEFSELPEETGLGDDINYFSLACFLYPNFYYENNDDDERV